MSTPPEQDPPAPPDVSGPPARARPRWLLPVLIAGGAVSAVAIVAVLVLTLGRPAKLSLTGTLTIGSATTEGPLPAGFACAGAGPLSDIQPALRVVVADGNHELLGKGELTSSFSGGADSCVFAIVVHDLPLDRDDYLVQISHRGEASFTQAEAVSGIELTLTS